MTDKTKIKILLIDDDEMVRIFFRDLFWIHGLEDRFSVDAVESADKAETIIKDPATRPDIIFVDLVMPVQGDGRVKVTPEAGFKFLERIKKDPELKDIRIIIFSGHDEPRYKKKAKELGAENYLVKGEHLPQDLQKIIENL